MISKNGRRNTQGRGGWSRVEHQPDSPPNPVCFFLKGSGKVFKPYTVELGLEKFLNAHIGPVKIK